jgi:hypothetical protein
MGFPAHPDSIGRGRYHFEPQTLCETLQVCFPSEFEYPNQIEHCHSERSEGSSYFYG